MIFYSCLNDLGGVKMFSEGNKGNLILEFIIKYTISQRYVF